MSALTRNQQGQGQRQILLGAAINPLGAGFIMGPVVGLLALHYGASDVTMGFIYAGRLPQRFVCHSRPYFS